MSFEGLITLKKFSHLQKGFTLIEIMIALLLGAFLIGGILQIFINTRETYRMQDALSRLQENGRFAMDFIGRDLRMVDYRSCPQRNGPVVDAGGNMIGITGADGVANGALQDSPDSFQVRWMEGNICPLAAANLRTVSYTVGVTAGTNPPITELRRDTGAGAMPLIEGVENVQILYGVDTDADINGIPNYYGPAATVANMGQVVSVRVSILLYTIDANVVNNPLAINFNNEPTLADRRIRRVFTSTFTLRNRLG